jgi:putative ABC transport system substrate-binding protein
MAPGAVNCRLFGGKSLIYPAQARIRDTGCRRGTALNWIERRKFVLGLGGAIAVLRPLPLGAQQPMPTIGLMSSRAPDDSVNLMEAMRTGLGELGFVEGRNVAIEYRWARGDYGLLPALARELVSRKVSVLIAAGGDASVIAAIKATSTIPIVFGSGSDPVKAGFVSSINRPGGNVTGISITANQMEAKRFGLVNEMVPGRSLIGILMNEKFPPAARQLSDLEHASRTLQRPLFVAKAGNDAELDKAFAALSGEKLGAILVAADPFFDTRRKRIVDFTVSQRVPTMFQFREFALEGGLVSYGVNLAEAYRLFGARAAKLLKGQKPAELPVQQVEKFELVINLKTAKAIGFEFPPTFSARANEVIE